MTDRLPEAALTSGHRSGVPRFERMYAGTAPIAWEIAKPQPRIQELADSGAFHGRVLDVGCGTGDIALMAASLGLPTLGVDAAPTAIAHAKRKAAAHGIEARFLEWDALNLAGLEEQFDTVIDIGLFHCFADADRTALADSLAAALAPGGRYFMMCFSDKEPGTWGPRRIPESDIRSSFPSPWHVETLEPALLTINPGFARAWLAVMTRT